MGVGLEIKKAHVGPKENRWALGHAWDWAKIGNGFWAQSKIKIKNDNDNQNNNKVKIK